MTQHTQLSLFNEINVILIHVLSLSNTMQCLTPATPLLGAMPEFDSMTAVAIVNALEKHFDFHINDDELDASVFATVESLMAFVAQKRLQK